MNHLSREWKTALSTVQVPLILTRLPHSERTLKQQMKSLQQTHTVSHSFSILAFAFASWYLLTYPHCRASFSKYITRYKRISSKGWYFPLHHSSQLHNATGCWQNGVISCNNTVPFTQWNTTLYFSFRKRPKWEEMHVLFYTELHLRIKCMFQTKRKTIVK